MTSLPIEVLDREHPDYTVRKTMWQRYADLYTGGEVMRINAQAYLPKRQKEPAEVYYERLSRVFYENYIGSIVDWYAATLLRTEPSISVAHDEQQETFYNLFLDDCDLAGTDFVEFFRKAFIQALVYQQSYVLIDFPHVDAPTGFKSRAEEDAAGKSRAYLVNYSPLDVPNYKLDLHGNLEWAVIRTKERFQASFESATEVERTTWTYFDRTGYRKYQLDSDPQRGQPSRGEVPLIESGPHALSESGRVPIVIVGVSDGLWLLNKSALLQLEHFNKANALAWSLHMGLFAMPVIYSERDWHQVVGESYYIQLGVNDRFGWTEPECKVYQVAQDNLDTLKNEIYRVCYLMMQAAGNSAANVTQSAASKQRDYSITHEVLRAYGDMLKGAMKNTLRMVAAARLDDISVDVRGLDQFDIADLSGELSDAQAMLQIVDNSPTFRKEVQKRLALKMLDDSEPALKNQIVREIEQA